MQATWIRRGKHIKESNTAILCNLRRTLLSAPNSGANKSFRYIAALSRTLSRFQAQRKPYMPFRYRSLRHISFLSNFIRAFVAI